MPGSLQSQDVRPQTIDQAINQQNQRVHEQADQLLTSALEAYHSLEQLARKGQSVSALMGMLRARHQQVQDIFNTQLSTPLLPLRPLANFGMTWRSLDQTYSNIDPDSAPKINTLIAQIDDFEFQLQSKIDQHQTEKNYWTASEQVARRELLDAFIDPTGKEGWELSTLLIAQRAVIEPYFEALKLAEIPNYLAAAHKLNESWKTYRHYETVHQIQADLVDTLKATPEIDRALQQLSEIELELDTALVDPPPEQARILKALNKEARKYQEEIEHFLDIQQRAVRENKDLNPADRPDCLTAISELHSRVLSLTSPTGATEIQTLSGLGNEVEAKINALVKKHHMEHDELSNLVKLCGQLLSELDGTGFNRKKIQDHRVSLRGIQRTYDKLSDEQNDLEKRTQAFLSKIETAIYETQLHEITAEVQALETEKDGLSAKRAALKIKIEQMLASIRVSTIVEGETLTESTAEIQVLHTELQTRLSWYRSNNPPIPSEFIESKDTLLKQAMVLGSVKNTQAHERTVSQLETYVAGGLSSDFPTQAEAMALFAASLGEGRSTRNWLSSWVSNETANLNAEVDNIMASLTIIDIKGLKTKCDTACLDITPLFPQWSEALKNSVSELTDTIKESGPKDTEAQKTHDELEIEISNSKTKALSLKTLKEKLEEHKNTINIRLNSQRSAARGLVLGMLGRVASVVVGSEELQSEIETKRTEAFESLDDIDSLESATECEDTLKVLIAEYEALIANTSTIHLITLEDQAKADKAEEVRQKTENTAAWRILKAQYTEKMAAAVEANATEGTLSGIETTFQQLDISYEDGFDTAKTTIEALMRRLESAAQRPEEVFQSIGKALFKLDALWKKDISTYKREINILFAGIENTDIAAEQELGASAVTKLSVLRDYFREDAFEADVFLLATTDAISLDQRRAARERALKQLREYRRRLEGSPLIRMVFSNPFSMISLGNIISTLNKIEFNLIQSV